MNLGNATGHPSFVMSNSFTNQVLAQIEICSPRPRSTRPVCYVLPKHLDEEVARLHLPAPSVPSSPSCPRTRRPAYLGVARRTGPYKSDHYRY